MVEPNYWRLYYGRRQRRRRRRPPRYRKPELRVTQILAWADAHHARTGAWPKADSGRIPGSGGETWRAVHEALRHGYRGLPGGPTLAQLLAEQRGHRNIQALSQLTIKQILSWADAFQRRTGSWPVAHSGPVLTGSQETWRHVDDALRRGSRGLPGGSSLPQLLEAKRGVAKTSHRTELKVSQILAWADRHQRRTGQWPKSTSGPVVGAAGEDWLSVHHALYDGLRGLPGGQSLAQFLAQHRGARNLKSLPRYTIKQILAWADAHHRRSGQWPYSFSGPIPQAPGETWKAVDAALKIGRRGLPGGNSLTKLLAQERGMRNRQSPPQLSVTQILAWADAFHRKTGRWPRATSERIPETAGETWAAVDRALKQGKRGLLGGSSLARLLLERRQVRSQSLAPRLTVQAIRRWAAAHQRRTGQWPTTKSGSVPEALGETWSALDMALRLGLRGLPRGLSLAQLRSGKTPSTAKGQRPP